MKISQFLTHFVALLVISALVVNPALASSLSRMPAVTPASDSLFKLHALSLMRGFFTMPDYDLTGARVIHQMGVSATFRVEGPIWIKIKKRLAQTLPDILPLLQSHDLAYVERDGQLKLMKTFLKHSNEESYGHLMRIFREEINAFYGYAEGHDRHLANEEDLEKLIVEHESIHQQIKKNPRLLKNLYTALRMHLRGQGMAHPLLQAMRADFGPVRVQEMKNMTDAQQVYWYLEEFVVQTLQKEKFFPDQPTTPLQILAAGHPELTADILGPFKKNIEKTIEALEKDKVPKSPSKSAALNVPAIQFQVEINQAAWGKMFTVYADAHRYALVNYLRTSIKFKRFIAKEFGWHEGQTWNVHLQIDYSTTGDKAYVAILTVTTPIDTPVPRVFALKMSAPDDAYRKLSMEEIAHELHIEKRNAANPVYAAHFSGTLFYEAFGITLPLRQAIQRTSGYESLDHVSLRTAYRISRWVEGQTVEEHLTQIFSGSMSSSEKIKAASRLFETTAIALLRGWSKLGGLIFDPGLNNIMIRGSDHRIVFIDPHAGSFSGPIDVVRARLEELLRNFQAKNELRNFTIYSSDQFDRLMRGIRKLPVLLLAMSLSFGGTMNAQAAVFDGTRVARSPLQMAA